MRAGLRSGGYGALLTAVLLAAAVAVAQIAVPPLAARVTDQTGTLTSEQQSALEQKLADFEKRKGSQIAVLIVPTTEPEEIEQYSIRVVDAWKLGRKGIDDGVLLLIAKDDKRMRFEVGRGLEGAVPDIYAKRIIADTVTPYFKQGDFYGGIDAGLTQLIGLIDGEPLPEPDPHWENRGGGLEAALPLLLIIAVVAGSILRRLFGRLPGALTTGGLVGVVAGLIAGLLSIGVVAGIIGFVIALMGGMSSGGWSSGRGGGWGGGGFGGGGFGGGGFGGGGGGFGGGGASGGW